MNEGTRRGEAQGITIGSLLKISETRGVDKKTTVLDYVVRLLVEKGQGDALEFSRSPAFAALDVAGRVSLSDVEGTAARMSGDLKRVEREAAAARDAGETGPADLLAAFSADGSVAVDALHGACERARTSAGRLAEHFGEKLAPGWEGTALGQLHSFVGAVRVSWERCN